MTQIKYTAEDIGSETLRALSKGLYSEPYHAIREYLQNAVDAFPNNIDMTIQENSIFIVDDGEGMDKKGVNTCRKVGISEKKPEEHIGWRGIGIWAGLIYAKKFKLTTTKKGVPKKYVLKIDFEKINEGVSEEKILTRLLSKHVTLDEEPAEKNEHFSFVELLDITKNGKKLIEDEQALKDYISVTLPLEYPDDFKHKDAINNLLTSNVSDYRPVSMKFNGTDLYRLAPSSDLLRPPEGRHILDSNKEPMAYMWTCVKYKEIPKKFEKCRGMIYKIKGFTIGNNETPRILWQSNQDHLHFWYFGEIHIINLDITPNTAREDLEPSDEQRIFFEKSEEAFDELRVKANNISKKEGASRKIKEIKKELSNVKKKVDKVQELKLDELIEVQSDTNDAIGELDYRGDTLKKVPKKEKKKILEDIDSTLSDLNKYSKEIDKEIKKRDKELKEKRPKGKKKVEKKKLKETTTAFDDLELEKETKSVLEIVIKNLTKIIEDSNKLDKFIKNVKADIKKKIK